MTGDAEQQEVDIRLAELPVRAAHRQPPRAAADRADAHQKSGQVVVADLERPEEALQALVVGVPTLALPPKPVARSARLTLRIFIVAPAGTGRGSLSSRCARVGVQPGRP